ncbi:MAG: ECF transporter S component [Clostridia bacterium]|nr:ECF transporter S component [Clostridia bacterium]
MNKTVSKQKKYTLKWITGTALMIAVTLVLGNTPLGLIAMPFLKATTLHIPVIIATLFLGWESGMLCGLTFGIHSLINNAFSGGTFFAPFFINPLVSVLPRVLFPLAVYGLGKAFGTLFSRLKQGRLLSCILASALGTAVHTAMVMGMVYVLYGGRIEAMLQGGLGVPDSIAANGVGMGILVLSVTNGVPELIVAAVIAPVIVIALDKSIGRTMK